jgi:PAS domain S-box-containing protein
MLKLKIDRPNSADFLTGGGEMGELTRAFDWSATSLGKPESWPQSLRTAVRILLNASHPMFIWWGADLIQFYNDAYRQTMGPERHPSALGQGGRKCWHEIWPIIGPQIEQVMSGGGATWHEKQLIPITRHGSLEQVYWTYGFSPIDQDDGVGGVLVVCRDVTTDYLATKALREREVELARVQQLGRIGGVEMDLRTGIRTGRSPEYLRIHGLPPGTTNETHEDWLRRLHPDERGGDTERTFNEVLASNAGEYTFQYKIIRPSDGETRWISVKAGIERDEHGKAIRLIGAHTDVTEQVLAEQALRQSEERYRKLADQLTELNATLAQRVEALREREAELARVQQLGRIGGLDVDLRTGIRNRRSPEYLYVHGLPPDTLNETHQDWLRRVHPDDREATDRKVQDIFTSDAREYSVQYRIIRPSDGETRWISVRSSVERDEHGKAIRLIGAHTDVTEQVLAEQALRQSEERYRKLADQLTELNATLAQRVEEKTRERDRIWNVSQDLLVVTDRDGVWQTVNPAWTRTLGWSEADLLKRTSEWLEHPDDNGTMQAQMERLGAGETTVKFEGRFRDKDGSYRWLSWTGVSDRNRSYAVARDVTAEKAAAERLRATEEALHQSQKMEAVGQLTGGIAHDFNNLLTGIVGSLNLLQTRFNQGRTEKVTRYIDAAMTSANRAASLTHRLLAFARRQPLIPKSVDVNRLVVSLEDLLRRTIGETIRLEIAASNGLWWTLCDPNQLESALINLAINARDAMPEGGRLTIATSNARIESVDAEAPALSPGDYICIGVTDSGVGMKPDVAARAFDPFFTTKPMGQGTGLGLSMIYGFARQSNGHATIDSKVEQGTTVRLYLPRHHGDISTPHTSAVGKIGQAAIGKTVLVIEDEPVVRAVIIEMLAEQGYQTLEAIDGPTGVEILLSSERIDLLVTDIGLPGMNGRQVADRAREARPGLRILFITGYAESAAMSEGFLQPGMELITKPFDLNHFAQRIRAMISA